MSCLMGHEFIIPVHRNLALTTQGQIAGHVCYACPPRTN